jgi:hypothetical protein
MRVPSRAPARGAMRVRAFCNDAELVAIAVERDRACGEGSSG